MNLEAEKIELIQLLLDSDNEEVLKEIRQLLQREQNAELPDSQKAELDRRLKKNAEGQMKFYSLEEFENRLNEPR
ncbi:MAG: hypothetical protein CL524_05745 [Aequorivita sp.]|nr:hypothetical protein [Aequorivita sp.]MBF32545.1 hypothetical protein [Aequorivita sp.]|tara:strand:- start:54561 stop:54785 length:225 start_codon:yes stop_codon:yes gene_type:complete